MNIYIDESGNLGNDPQNRFFVISAVIFLNEKRIKNIVKRYKVIKKIEEIKGSCVDFRDRQFLINGLNSKNDYFISYIILDKKNIDNQKLFEDKNILFNFLCSFLFKKIIKNSKEDIKLIFDNRTVKVKSGNSLFDYLKIKSYTEWNYSGDLSIDYVDSKCWHCTQMIDLISNTIYRAYKIDNLHFYNLLKISDSIRFPQNKFLK